MNQVELGTLISQMRKKAGYTQAELAAALFVTDKAVSKWERGLCSPDNSLLPKLAGLLDTDLASLLPDNQKMTEWKGLLILRNSETSATTIINEQPLIHYLLSYFLLLGITNVAIITDDKSSIQKMNLSQYGFNISFSHFKSDKTMVVFGKCILLGAYLTQQLLNIMSTNESTIPVIDGIKIPFLFSHHSFEDYKTELKKSKCRRLYRGMIHIPLDSMENITDAETLIHIYEKYNRIHFCSLQEIANNRGITI